MLCVFRLMIEEQVLVNEPGFADSFEKFYADCWHKVYRALAVGIGDRDLAREAVDEAMARAYERWRSVSTMTNREGWVYRVASNWATSRLRRRRLQLRRAPDPETIYQPEVADPELLEAIRGLSTRYRDVVVARYLLDMSESATAQALGIPEGTVKSRLSRALAELKESLS
jgi:RNA polymerase sigma factor (sigma-70 family)